MSLYSQISSASSLFAVRKRDVCADRGADENILFLGEMLSFYLQYSIPANQVWSGFPGALLTSAHDWGDMREADMKCKVAAWLLLPLRSPLLVRAACLLHSVLIAATLTRSRKVAAEDVFCCQFLVDLPLRVNQFMLGCALNPSAVQQMRTQNSQQKILPGEMTKNDGAVEHRSLSEYRE